MSRLKAAVFIVVFALSASAVSAQASLPPIVQKFTAAVGKAQTLSVEMTQTYRFLPVQKPAMVTRTEFSLEKPNKFAVTWTSGSTPIAAAASDGTTLSEWDTRSNERQPAPKTLEAMLIPLRRGPLLNGSGAVAANIAFVLFTHPDAFVALPGAELKDVGTEDVGGISAHKVVASTATYWFASDTGLPVQAVFSDETSRYTIRFLTYTLDKPISESVFAAAPSGPLTGMRTEHAALHFLPAGTPAPDFMLQTLDGKPVTLSALKGRVILLAFCPPYLPGNFTDTALLLIQKARAKLDAKDLAVLWIAETDHPEREAPFAQAHLNAGLTVLLDPAGLAAMEQKLYHVQATPTFYVISRTGRVTAGFAGSLPEKQAVIQADTRAAAVSVLTHEGVRQSPYDQAEDMMDEASLQAALTAAGLKKQSKAN